jgi:Ran GTPase-activating protein (RanGAP) involved in mRNA processing and transport
VELDMSGKMKGAADAIMLVPEIIDNGALSKLSLKDNALCTKEAGKALAALAGNSVLKELDLSNNSFYNSRDDRSDGPGFAQDLAIGIKDNRALSMLSMKSNNLRVEGGKALAEGLKGNSVITELNIADNDLADYGQDMSGVIAIANVIKEMGALSSLSLKNNRLVTKEAGRALATALAANSVLKELDLSSNAWAYSDYDHVHADGPGFAQELAVVIKDNGALLVLSLKSNSLRAGGGRALAEGLKGNQLITELNISDNDFHKNKKWEDDMSGIIALADVIADMGALSSLNLSMNRLGGFHEYYRDDGSGYGNFTAAPEGKASQTAI